MKKKIFAFILLSTLYFLLSTSIASAWTWGEPLVPCGTSANPATCTRCDLFHLLKNLIDFGLFAIVPVGGTLLFILAGIYYILGAANPSLLGRGKTIFENSFYAIVMIALAWLITNTILSNLGDNVSGNWYSFQCVNPTALPTLPPPTGTPTPSGTVTPTPTSTGKCGDPTLCSNLAGMASACKVPYPHQNSPALNAMISCISAGVASQGVRLGPTHFTYDESHDSCNFTRGKPICDSTCSHGTTGSCHTGGNTGTQGAEAVDLNAGGGSEIALCRAIKNIYNSGQCPGMKLVNFEGNHTHVSTTQCDQDVKRVIGC